jgi:hypothetical protein
MLARIIESEIASMSPLPKRGSRDAENDVGVPALARERVAGRQETRLRDVATRGVAAARDDKQIMHAAVVGAVGIPFEPRLPDGTI